MNVQEAELQILSSIQTPEDLSELRLRGLKVDDFQCFPNALQFICDYAGEYGDVPSRSVLTTEFGELELHDAESKDLEYLTDFIIKSSIKRNAERVISRGVDLLVQGDPTSAIDYIGTHLYSLKRSKKVSKSYTDRDAEKRYDAYVKKRKLVMSGEPVGIKTGLSVFDDKLIGWSPGNCILFLGYQGVGKSFISLKTAHTGYIQGNSVLYVSPEMTVPEVEARWDTIHARSQDLDFSNEALLYGQKLDHEAYKGFLKESSKRGDWVTADSAEGKPLDSDSIFNMVEEFSPDILVVDGLYLIRGDDGSVGSWQGMVSLVNNLKSIAIRKRCVVICTSQTADAEGRVAYSRYLGQPMDFIVWMAQDPEGDDSKRMLQVTKVRSGRRPIDPMFITYDPDSGIIGE